MAKGIKTNVPNWGMTCSDRCLDNTAKQILIRRMPLLKAQNSCSRGDSLLIDMAKKKGSYDYLNEDL
jgi:hypothetical protein